MRRRICVSVLCLLVLLLVAAWRLLSSRHVAQWQHLSHVIQLEAAGVNERNVQPLGWSLAILGRDDEIRSMDFHPLHEFPPLTVNPEELDVDVVAWREGIRRIAQSHRIVMIMEDHFVSKHREIIRATLPIFRQAGFTHYAAEGIGESSASLAGRGYPTVKSGFYTSDPQFGNLLRRALDLRYTVTGYDFRPFSHESRENYAARELAQLIQEDPKTKLLVHAGFAHVFKYETDIGQRWLASILWERTGIEPFTIWQWSSMHDGHEHRIVAKALGDFDEPMLLMPPPGAESGLRNVPRVDAILVHPPDKSVAPAQRTVLFPNDMQRVSGQWRSKKWPVVIAAYRRGEPATAIPLDQVMLRDGEQDFVLWVPASSKYDVVVFSQDGLLDSSSERADDSVIVRAGQ